MKNLQRWGSVTAIILVVANSHLVLIQFCLSEVVIQPPNVSPQYITDSVVSNALVWLCGHAGSQLQHVLWNQRRGALSRRIVGIALEIDLDEASW